jgi:nicotinamide-nucleotide amidase
VSNQEVAKSVIKALIKRKQDLAVAESITGGGLAAALTDIAGASEVFVGGVVAYSDQIKVSELGVSKSDLKKYGPVSEEIVRQMADGALFKFKTDYAIATTGVAGPGSAYGQKAGTAWIGLASKKERISIALFLTGDRESIRHATIASALAAIERILKP